MQKRVFLIVLDSCGIGAQPDAAAFGDVGSNTLRRIAQSPLFDCTHTAALGLGHIDGVSYIPRTDSLGGAVARLTEQSAGKDTTIGHWELAGLISRAPLPTYPQGFPSELLAAFSRETGRGVLCNRPYSGTDVLRDYGAEHLRTGSLIVYTSADSVFQIAAHESVVPPEQLYEYCRIARRLLCGPHAVGRVIARPFVGEPPAFTRTANRRDFSLPPPRPTLLDALCNAGQEVVAVGKITDIFAGRGITESVRTHNNEEGLDETLNALARPFHGLCFVNLVDFDMLYGHRQDVAGYAAAFAAFDRRLPAILAAMQPDDLLFVTADHGCDPGDSHTDHTREYTPLLIAGRRVRPQNLGTRQTFADVAATVADYLEVPFSGDGRSFLPDLLK